MKNLLAGSAEDADAFDLDLSVVFGPELPQSKGECKSYASKSCPTSTSGYCTCTYGTCARTCGGITGSPCAC